MNILFFGDVVGKPGRESLASALPELREKYSADLVLANIENMAHGYGFTPETVEELQRAGVDVFTGGNHSWKNKKGRELLAQEPEHIIRPANVSEKLSGRGWTMVERNGQRILVINLLGRVFMDLEAASPFETFDAIVEEHGQDTIVLVDIHAEATGEKRIMGWHVNGRAAAIVGTHTHVPTRDAQLLSEGTAYITDLGMCGAAHSSLGMNIALANKKVVQQEPVHLEPPENPERGFISGVCVSVDDKTKRATNIAVIDREISL